MGYFYFIYTLSLFGFVRAVLPSAAIEVRLGDGQSYTLLASQGKDKVVDTY